MTTNKPEVVAWLYEGTKLGNIFEDEPNEGFWFVPETETGPRSYIKGQPVIRLSDYEALQAECEKLRKDAARYRFIRDAEELPMNLMRLEMIGDVMDSAIDAAMEEHNP